MLTYHLTQRGDHPMYEYLSRCIREDILAGRLGAGEKLPSKRALARHLEVSVVTVENAYAQLVAEGYLLSQERRGYFVAHLEMGPALPVSPSGPVTISGEAEKETVLDLRSGGGGEGFPFSVWAKLMRRALTQYRAELLRAVPHNGVTVLRQAIADHLYRFRGMQVGADQVVVGAGSELLCDLLVQLLGRNRVYGVEEPSYPKPRWVYELAGAQCCVIPVDEQGIPPHSLSNTPVDVLHCSPSHQFPTGAITPVSRRLALLQWAEQGEDRYIIEDDYDSEFRFTGRPIQPLQTLDRSGRVIYMNTFSRSIASSLRISYLVLPPTLVQWYHERLGFRSCTVPALEQYTLAHFLDEGHFDQHINRMRVRYRARRDQVVTAIGASALSSRCQILQEDAGLHFLLRLDTHLSDEFLTELAEERGIRLAFLSQYCTVPTPQRAHHLVVNYPGANLARLPEALDWLGSVL